jgi:hypothetical protein
VDQRRGAATEEAAEQMQQVVAWLAVREQVVEAVTVEVVWRLVEFAWRVGVQAAQASQR